MRYTAKTLLGAACALLVLSCSVGREPFRPRPVYGTVPSDALALAVCSNASDILEYFGEGSALRELDLCGADGGAAAVWGYYGSLQQMLCVPVPSAECVDSLPWAGRLLLRSRENRLYSKVVTTAGGSAIIVTPSENMFTATCTHVKCGTGIMDAPRFGEAAALAGEGDALFCRAGALGRLLPASLGDIPSSRRDVVNFLTGAAEWYVVSRKEEGGALKTVSGEGNAYYANILARWPQGSCEFTAPVGCRFALSMSVDPAVTRGLREEWLDARTKLVKYHSGLSGIRNACGTNPVAWEKSAGIREVAVVETLCRDTLVLLRAANPGKNLPDSLRLFPEALYGKLFALPSGSESVVDGNWIICGKRDAMERYIMSPKMETPLSDRPCRVALRYDSLTLVSDEDGTVYKTE